MCECTYIVAEVVMQPDFKASPRFSCHLREGRISSMKHLAFSASLLLHQRSSKMASLRHLSSTLRTAAARSSIASSSSRISSLSKQRGYATEATTSGSPGEPAPIMGFKQTTVEELHSQTAHDVLAGALARVGDGRIGRNSESTEIEGAES